MAMERAPFEQSNEKPRTPAEEISSLREEIRTRSEAHAAESGGSGAETPPSHEQAAEETLAAYSARPAEEVLSEGLQMQVDEIETAVLHLSPEHDKKIDELVAVIEEKGIKNALSIVRELNDPHFEDDFHRFLVQYLQRVGSISGLKEGTDLYQALSTTLYEITLPKSDEATEGKAFSDLVAAMEQFYAGMRAISDKKERRHFTFEIALSRLSDHITFYCAVPRAKASLFEKQLLSVFPDARLTERKEDYNPFLDDGVTAAAYARLVHGGALPIRTYDDFDRDPLTVILNAFSKLAHEEGASIQYVMQPEDDTLNTQFRRVRDRVKKGEPFKRASEGEGRRALREAATAAGEFIFGGSPQQQQTTNETEDNTYIVEAIDKKIAHAMFRTNIRIVASADTKERAQEILSELEAAFYQFKHEGANEIRFERTQEKYMHEMHHAYSFRLFADKRAFPLNVRELTTVFHLPVTEQSTAQLKQSAVRSAAPPQELPEDGVIIGANEHQGTQREIRVADEDRMRHFYVIGQTGTGKTALLKNMITQDIERGHGVCMIDPHGTDVQDVLATVPDRRIDDVIYFDPAYTKRPMGLNMLEYDPEYPEQKTFVVDELLNIFKKLYAHAPEGLGPIFEQYFRNAAMLVIEDPESGSTLLDISRVLSDAEFRKLKLSRCNNPVVTQFWQEVAGQAGGEASLENIVPYITSKFDVFMANEIMRPIIAQQHSAFNFRQVMDERKILLVNLSKGKIGDLNANLIGLIMVGKILMSALSRVDATERPDFFLYIDEFQNVTTDSIATILSEARKYRLGLTLAHQFIAQLNDSIRDAVFGNVGSMATFRVGNEDAQHLEQQFSPRFSASDLANVENYNAYVKMLVHGHPSDPFNIRTYPPAEGDPEVVGNIKELSYLRYGRDRAEVEAEIAERYRS